MRPTDDDHGLLLGRYLPMRDLTGPGPFDTRLVHDGADFAVIKRLKKSYHITADLRSGIEGSMREWESAGRHPCSVAVLSRGEIDGDPYLVLEYVAPGAGAFRSLAGAFMAGGPGPARALRWMVQLARALEHSEKAGSHCAPAPGSVLIGADDRVKLSNFGALNFTGILRSHEFIPPSHLAPEQHEDPRHGDIRAAVYLFGILLYQAMTGGAPPFTAAPPRDASPKEVRRHAEDLLRKKKNRNYHGFLRRRETAPLAGVIERCLDPNPHGRPDGFAELAGELAVAARDLAAPGPAPVPEPYWGLFNRGAAYLEGGMHREAVHCFDELIDAVDSPFPWLYLGLSLAALGVADDAIECVTKAVENDPAWPDSWRHLGMLYHDRGFDRDALACLEKAAGLDPADPRGRETMGRLCLRLERFDRALELFVGPPSFQEHDSAAWRDRGDAFAGLGYHQRALECYDRALDLAPGDTDLSEKRGACLLALGRHGDAAGVFAEIAGQRKDSAGFWAAYGDALLAAGKADDAAACYDRALEIDPRDSSLWHRKGRALLEGGSHAEAARAFDRVLAADPGDTYALNARGTCLLRGGDHAGALACFDAALAAATEDALLLKHRADCLIGMKRFDEALESIERARSLDPADPGLDRRRAEALQGAGLFEKAAAAYCAYLARAPRDAAAWLNGGTCFYNMGMKEGAVEFFRACIMLDPGSERAIFLKAKTEEELSRNDRAVSGYLHYLAVSGSDDDESAGMARRSLDALAGDLSPGGRQARLLAHREAVRTRRPRVLPHHLLFGAAVTVSGGASADHAVAELTGGERLETETLLARRGIDPARLAERLRSLAGSGSAPHPGTVHLSPDTRNIIAQARRLAGATPAGLRHFFSVLLANPDPVIRAALERESIDGVAAARSLMGGPGAEPIDPLVDAFGKTHPMEIELTTFLARFLAKKLGPGWEEEVSKRFREPARKKAAKNREKKHLGLAVSILDAATLGEKGEIIRHGDFWNHFREVFARPGKKEAYSRQFIEDRFAKMNALHSVQSHPQPHHDTIITAGLGAFSEIIAMIREYGPL